MLQPPFLTKIGVFLTSNQAKAKIRTRDLKEKRRQETKQRRNKIKKETRKQERQPKKTKKK